MQKKKTIWTIHSIHDIDNLLQIYHVYWAVRDLSREAWLFREPVQVNKESPQILLFLL